MIYDAKSVDHGAALSADVVIVGAGAAGITIAREFIGSSLRVVLLESGDLEPRDDTQALCGGKNTGFPYHDLDKIRRRVFGGSTIDWAGACRPLDPMDFEKRDAVPFSGWPVDRASLDPFYERAHATIGLGEFEYDIGKWEGTKGRRLPLSSGRVWTDMVRINPIHFGVHHHDSIEAAGNIEVFLNANALGVNASPEDGPISSVSVGTLDGSQFEIQATVVVIACGGVENARLLLLSNQQQPAGLGNRNDLVGRYFMDHITVPAAILLPADRNMKPGIYEGVSRAIDTVVGRGCLSLDPDWMRAESLLNFRAFLGAGSLRERDAIFFSSRGVAGAAELLDKARSGELGDGLGYHLQSLITDFDDVVMFGYRRFFDPNESASNLFYILSHIEQAPNPASRVTLGDDLDALGQRRAKLHWKFGDLEKRTMRLANRVLAEEIGRAGIGRLLLTRENAEFEENIFQRGAQGETGWPPGVCGAWHQMGTTRMHDDPAQGVVDSQCEVHGVKNLFVAGSSVFPTSGGAHPTLTIVALAIRLADHIKGAFS